MGGVNNYIDGSYEIMSSDDEEKWLQCNPFNNGIKINTQYRARMYRRIHGSTWCRRGHGADGTGEVLKGEKGVVR